MKAGGSFGSGRRPPEVAVCVVIWTVECPIRMCRITYVFFDDGVVSPQGGMTIGV